jgi:hypothetical protein
MDSHLVALKLVLDELDVPANILTVDDRKQLQKAVYLGQVAGVDLGYRFGWYLLGPYSPALTKDYYRLAEAIESGDESYQTQELQKPVRERLHRTLPLLAVPDTFPLGQEDWLELAASLHYLRKVSRYDAGKALEVIRAQKPQLAPFASQAEERLQQVGLL